MEQLSEEIRDLLAKKSEADAERHKLESELHKQYALIDQLEAQLIRAGAGPVVACW